MSINRRAQTQETGRLHRENMRRTLIQRMEVAKVNGNQQLVEQLEKERLSLGL